MTKEEAKLFIDILNKKIKENFDKRVKSPNINIVKITETNDSVKIEITNAVWKKTFINGVKKRIEKVKVELNEDNWDTYTMERVIKLAKNEFRRQYASKYDIK